MKIKANLLPWLIILAGVAYSLYLVLLVPEGVFFSGDGGLKALLAQQLSRGEFHIDLTQPSEAWIHQLWQQGLFPYEPPFVYYLNDKYFLSFPFPFPAISAPFYALFGYWGLYIIPLVSTWAIWIAVSAACQRLKFSNWQTCLALLALIFASSLTVYSAMYWEHTLAVSLCFIGMFLYLIPEEETGISRKNAILGGCLLGLSVWFRSELVAMVVTLVFLIYFVSFIKYIQQGLTFPDLSFLKKNRELFFLCTFLTIGAFFACNQLIYGRPLGIHAMLITEDFSWLKRVAESWNSFRGITLRLFEYFPLAIFPLFYLLLVLFQKNRDKFNFKILALICGLLWLVIGVVFFSIEQGNLQLNSFLIQGIIPLIIVITWLYLMKDQQLKFNARLGLIYGLSLLFIIGVSLLVDYAPGEVIVGGKQWGNRYVLLLLPWLSLLAVQELENVCQVTRQFPKNFSFAIVGLLLIIGLHKNLYSGNLFFTNSYQGVSPAIQALRERPEKFVVVSHQYAAQMLEPALGDDKIFFRADDETSLSQLATALKSQNQVNFIYVCYPYRECRLPEMSTEQLKFTSNEGQFMIKLSQLGVLGKYPIYQASILKIDRN
jgi:hypothetical protein